MNWLIKPQKFLGPCVVTLVYLWAGTVTANDGSDSLEAILTQSMEEEVVSVQMHQMDLVLQDILPQRVAALHPERFL